jgi:predicted nucleic acid-binding protein
VIILDTNVISEIMRPAPDTAVLAWLRGWPTNRIATTTINIAEIKYGLARLEAGKRRRDLESKFFSFVSLGFANRILGFDEAAAEAYYGDLVVARERIGRPLEGFDGLIAAIAKGNGLDIATRNHADFEECGVAVLNPWEDSL